MYIISYLTPPNFAYEFSMTFQTLVAHWIAANVDSINTAGSIEFVVSFAKFLGRDGYVHFGNMTMYIIIVPDVAGMSHANETYRQR